MCIFGTKVDILCRDIRSVKFNPHTHTVYINVKLKQIKNIFDLIVVPNGMLQGDFMIDHPTDYEMIIWNSLIENQAQQAFYYSIVFFRFLFSVLFTSITRCNN